MQRVKPAYFGRHHQRLARDVALLVLRVAREAAPRARLAEAFDLDLADGFRDPLRRIRLTRLKEDLRRWLRQHRLCNMAVQSLDLALSLEAQHHRIVRFSVLRYRRRELRKTLQTRQLIEHEPRL